jgi:hypothetical protein
MGRVATQAAVAGGATAKCNRAPTKPAQATDGFAGRFVRGDQAEPNFRAIRAWNRKRSVHASTPR